MILKVEKMGRQCCFRQGVAKLSAQSFANIFSID